MPGAREWVASASNSLAAYDGEPDRAHAGGWELVRIPSRANFAATDMQLFNNSCYLVLFRGDNEVYFPPMDRVYLNLLEEAHLGAEAHRS